MSTRTVGMQASATAGTAPGAEVMEFADLVCGDPGLLRAEFDELIAASWDGPPPRWPFGPRRSPPQRPMPVPRSARDDPPRVWRPAQATGATEAGSRQRGPPVRTPRPLGRCDPGQ